MNVKIISQNEMYDKILNEYPDFFYTHADIRGYLNYIVYENPEGEEYVSPLDNEKLNPTPVGWRKL